MAVPGLPVSNIVNVQVSLSATPAQGENIDSMLIVGSSSVINVVERMRSYATLAGVAADFSNVSPEYLGAQLWFGQSPQPISVNIGRWAKTVTAPGIVGATLPAASQLLSVWTAITAGAFEIQIDAAAYAVTGLNFSSATNLNGVASIIQAGLISAGADASTTVVWNANYQRFDLWAQVTSGPGVITQPNLPTAVGNINFTGIPTAADTVTVNGTLITFVASGPSGNQVLIGSSAADQAFRLYTFLAASVDANISKMTFVSPQPPQPTAAKTAVYMVSKVAGAPGNAYTLAKSSTNATISGATLSGGTGTDISVLIGWNASVSGTYAVQGIAAESMLTAVQLLDNQFSNQWYGIACLGGADADYIAVAGYIEGANVKHYQGVTTQEAGALTTVDTSNLAYQLKTLGYKKTAIQFSSSNPYAAISYLARILTTDWQGNNTVITEMFKQEPGVVGESLNVAQAAALIGNNCNVFVNYNNNTTIIQPGVSCSGDWTDTIIAADWFAIQLQTDVFNALYTSPTKIPQTDSGMHILATIIEQDCVEAVNNGFLAPGVWQTTGFGAISNGTYLSKGYYIYQPPVSSQTPAARATRVSVPFQIAAKTAGAVHSANIAVTINQ